MDAHAFGPQGHEVAALVDRVQSSLTLDEERQLGAVWGPGWDEARDDAWRAAADAAWDEGRVAARDAAIEASSRGHWDDASLAAGAVAAAVAGLIVRDLVGDTFTQEHYDTLTLPWRKVIGSLHADDEAVPRHQASRPSWRF